MKVFNPEPKPGLRETSFRKICRNGIGDGHNSYAHSMAYLEDHLYVGTIRSLLVGARYVHKQIDLEMWPVLCPHPFYSKEFEQTARGEIWRYSILTDEWRRVMQAPLVPDSDGKTTYSREIGYRGMVAFQGKSDPKPAIYTSTFSRSKGNGPLILRSDDGTNFKQVGKPGLIGLPITSLRCLIPFKGRLLTAPTSAAGSNPNTSGVSVIYETQDPAAGTWCPINTPGFGDPDNRTIFEVAGFGDYLYAGTLNNHGFQLWRSSLEGEPPYEWSLVIERGAQRGSLNQSVASMVGFKGSLYIGTAIQGGGYDIRNNIGPAGAEIIRVHADGSWDLIMGDPRGDISPLSGIPAGFNSLSNGYLWKLGVHQGWLYAGTLDWSVMLQFAGLRDRKGRVFRMLEEVGLDTIVDRQGGFNLWRTHDGENWLPVTRSGFGNAFNYGVRNIVSTPYGLFIGTANPFGPEVAKVVDGEWTYDHNPSGGLEVWLGS